MNVPLCACHDVPMSWHKDSRVPAGGYWRCTPKRNANKRKANKSAKGKVTQAKYMATDKGHRARRIANGNKTFRARADFIQKNGELKSLSTPKSPRLTLRGTPSVAKSSIGSTSPPQLGG